MLPYNKNLKHFFRKLRRKMTDAENLLWSKIRGKQQKGYQFYRQKTIGNYIADFYCPKANLIIEIDGGQHYSPEGKEKDGIKDAYMANLGIKVIRFSDREVFEKFHAVIEEIWSYL